MSILKIYSQSNAIDVPEFLRWNINWIKVLSKTLYHNSMDVLLPQKKQKAIFAPKTVIIMLCTTYDFVNWTDDKKSRFFPDSTCAFIISGKRYNF